MLSIEETDMKKALGAAVILLASLYSAIYRVRRDSERIKLLLSVRESLLLMRRELSERRRTLSEVFTYLADQQEKQLAGSFYASIVSELNSLGDKRVAQIWRDAAEASFAEAGRDLAEILRPLGELMGSSDLERQLEEAEKCAREIEALARKEEDALPQKRRTTFGLTLSAGAFLVILLA